MARAGFLLVVGVFAASGCARNEGRSTPSDAVTPVVANETPAADDEVTTSIASAEADEDDRAVEEALLLRDHDDSAPTWKRTPDVIYVPTPQPVVDKMLEMAKVTKKDVVYDLGSGDGRIPVTAAKRYGAKAYGVDLDPERVEEALENVRKNKVEHLVTIEEGDVFELDLRPASVVTIYLLPELNLKLLPQLRELKPGSRVVTHDFEIEGIEPKAEYTWKPEDPDGDEHYVYLYVAPL